MFMCMCKNRVCASVCAFAPVVNVNLSTLSQTHLEGFHKHWLLQKGFLELKI